MIVIYLEPSELKDAFTADEKEMKSLWKSFDEYERLAAGKIRTQIPPNFPRVNDNSLMSFLQEMPMRVLAQLQTGSVKAINRNEAWVSELATIIWTNKIVPNANMQAPFLNKEQIALYRAAVYGSCPMFALFSVRDGYTGADFMIPYIRDVVWESKKYSDLDSDRVWLTSYYSENQIKDMLKNKAWDAKVLQKVLDAGAEERQNKNRSERDSSVATGGYPIITCFQKGYLAPVYSIAPLAEYKVARKTVNRNPLGDLPIANLYCYETLETLLGRGLVEMAGPTQNVLDFITQAHMFATQIGLQPPVSIRGRTETMVESSIVYAANKKWRLGEAVVEPVSMTTQVYTQMPQVYGLYKTQLMNILGYNDTTVSSSAGNPSYSKTPAGIQQGQQRTSAHDNYYRKRCDEAFGRLAKIMLNLHMANMEGQDVIKLYEKDITHLRNAGVNIPADDNELEIEWNDLRATFDFYVDENSSKVQDDEETVAKLSEVINAYANNPRLMQMMEQAGFKFNIGEAEKQRITLLGIPNSENIVVAQPVAPPPEVPQGPPAPPSMPQAPMIPSAPMASPAQPPIMQPMEAVNAG